jgi:hypothetical protein
MRIVGGAGAGKGKARKEKGISWGVDRFSWAVFQTMEIISRS